MSQDATGTATLILTDGGKPVKVYHDATSGDWVEVEGDSERGRRVEAASRLGCDTSDIRRGYDHSGREAEGAVVAEGILRDASGGKTDE